MDRDRKFLMAIALLVVIFLTIMLSGCGSITSGTIVEKLHEDARHYEEWDYCKTQYPTTKTRIVTDYEGNTSLETYTDMECQGGMVTRFDDEDWKIKIEKCEEPETPAGIEGSPGSNSKKSDKPKCDTNWFELDSAIYATLKVGDFYDRGAK